MRYLILVFFCVCLPITVFIYTMPGYKCPVKERMLYSSCKAPFLYSLEQMGFELAAKVSDEGNGKGAGCGACSLLPLSSCETIKITHLLTGLNLPLNTLGRSLTLLTSNVNFLAPGYFGFETLLLTFLCHNQSFHCLPFKDSIKLRKVAKWL